jgi:hypothetical protein
MVEDDPADNTEIDKDWTDKPRQEECPSVGLLGGKT